jgi:SAM-dependent methyltransferase
MLHALRRRVPEPLKKVIRRARGWTGRDYRDLLFDEVAARIAGRRALRILEIGPKDGKDTAHLLTLDPAHLLLIDLEDKKDEIEQWYPKIARPSLTLRYGNLMYESWVEELEPFDLVWCTGVLYHNPEQLRMISKLFDLTKPGGLLVIESATARRRALRDENCVELWYPPPDAAIKRKHHISGNVTHLPSRKAIESWLALAGFEEIRLSDCHRRQSRALARVRAAFVATRGDKAGIYYSVRGHHYEVGKSR